MNKQKRKTCVGISCAMAIGLSLCFAGQNAMAHEGHDEHEDSRQGMFARLDQRGGGEREQRGPRGPRENQVPSDADPVVEITVKGDYRYITGNGLPNHEIGRFPNRNNPHAPQEQRFKWRVPLEPAVNEEPTERGRYTMAVGLNGVPFDPVSAEYYEGMREWNYEALTGKLNLGADFNHAHVQPNGMYHYHGLPSGLIEIQRKANSLAEDDMVLIGYMADGFPIYALYGFVDTDDPKSGTKKLQSSYVLKKGTRPSGDAGPGGKYDGTYSADFEYVEGAGDLDECNGRWGVTPDYPEGTYYYVVTEEFPFVSRMFRGTPDKSFEKKHAGPRPRGGGGDMRGRPGGSGEERRGRPPRGPRS
ncbi:YHYH protein [Poriferisphaera sp. WC338]|uniref:YHYH protein n=1 Tax=Poriferisphaera sp. WC338 TaxID=3425129 RepID=UPI003D815D93